MPKPRQSKAAYTRKRMQEWEARREAVINEARATGASAREVCAAVGVPFATYQGWRAKLPEFSERFDAARRSAKIDLRTYDGSFVSFRQVYLHMETTWYQERIIKAIESARPGEVTMVLIPPGHGKTTLLEDWCTYKLVNDPSFRITVGSETVDHGQKVVDRVRSRYEPDGPTPEIARDFGPIAPESDPTQVWGQRRFNVAMKKASDERDYSMNCVGITGRVQGTRCDLLLLDDMQDVKSLEQSDKYFNIVTQSFLTRPEMFGRTVIIGTRVGEFDVYRKLLDAEIPDHIITIPAYDRFSSPPWPAPKVKPDIEDPSTWAPEGTKFLWPEKYNRIEEHGAAQPGLERYRYALLRHRVKEKTWWRNYMQAPEAASSMTFDKETTAKMRDELRSALGQPRPILPAVDGEEKRPVPVIIGVDPAIGGGNGVMSVAAYPKVMEVLTAHLDYSLSKYSQIIDLIEEDCHRFTTADSVVVTVVIEDKAFQRGLLSDDRLLDLQRRFGFRILPNTTGREKSDADIGVPAMEHAILRGEITIPAADEYSDKEMALLLDQMHQWRPGVSGAKLPMDLVMTLWFCYRQWRGIKDQPVHRYTGTEQWATSASPFHRRTTGLAVSRGRTMAKTSMRRSYRGTRR